MIFALITTTKLVSEQDLWRMGKALEQNVAHCCKAHQIYEPVAIVPIDKESHLPVDCYPVVMVDEGGEGGIVGEHWFDRKRQIPAARVLVQRATALSSGPYSVSEIASHEILEQLCNPMLAVWKPHPVPARARAGVEVAHEVCDPTQDHYVIRADGTDWNVSNFVTPFWFMTSYVGNPQAVKALEDSEGYGLDWLKRLKTPGEISSEGYAVLRERRADGGYRQWSEDMTGPLASYSRKLDRKQHPASRTHRLGGAASR